jgi:Ca2+-binding RTX toxin-like protein
MLLTACGDFYLPYHQRPVSAESDPSLGEIVMPYNFILKDKFGGRIDSNADVIYGKESNQSNGGNDIIKGLAGQDAIYANGGNDIIDAGVGNDSINGGFGDDTFYFGQNSGYDVIEDFGHSPGNTDKIVVDGFYNGYYKSPITREVVLKFDHDRDGYTDARVLLSGVGENEWLSAGNVISTNPSATQDKLAQWDQANANFFEV